MGTPFAARNGRLSAAIDRAFGEQFTFTARIAPPNGDVNLPRVDDPSKPAFTVVGIFEDIANQGLPRARGSAPDDKSLFYSAQYPSVSVNAALFTGHWVPFDKCLCTRLYDGSVYEIVRALPDQSRILFFLSNRKRPS